MLNKTYPFGATEGEAHFSPVASALSAVRTVPLAPTARRAGVSKFKKMFDALKNTEYSKAADEMLNSAWYRQTPSRCEELSNLMRSCY